MEPLTRWDVLRRVRQHFIDQENPFAVIEHPNSPLYGSTRCVYREEREDGTVLQCAIGCLIPVERYDPAWEGQGVTGVYGAISDLFGTDVDDHFLFVLQGQHDSIAERVFKGEIDEALGRKEFASRLNLIEELLLN